MRLLRYYFNRFLISFEYYFYVILELFGYYFKRQFRCFTYALCLFPGHLILLYQANGSFLITVLVLLSLFFTVPVLSTIFTLMLYRNENFLQLTPVRKDLE